MKRFDVIQKQNHYYSLSTGEQLIYKMYLLYLTYLHLSSFMNMFDSRLFV